MISVKIFVHREGILVRYLTSENKNNTMITYNVL